MNLIECKPANPYNIPKIHEYKAKLIFEDKKRKEELEAIDRLANLQSIISNSIYQSLKEKDFYTTYNLSAFDYPFTPSRPVEYISMNVTI